MAEPVKRRSYQSPLRRQQAASTREAIRSGAARLFERDGYARTTIGAVADAAGVSAETVYGTYGSKRELLAAVVEHAAAGTDEPWQVLEDEWVADLLAEPDGRRRLARMTERTRGMLERSAALYELVHVAAASDPGLRSLEAELDTRRRADVEGLVDLLAAVSPLRFERGEVVDLVWSLATSDLYLRLRRCGWPAERADELLESMIADVVFG